MMEPDEDLRSKALADAIVDLFLEHCERAEMFDVNILNTVIALDEHEKKKNKQ